MRTSIRLLRSISVTVAAIVIGSGAANAQQSRAGSPPVKGESAMNDPTYTAAMHKEHANEVPSPSAGALIPPRTPVAGEMVQYGTVDGKALRGYLTKPAGATGKGQALIMIHEWWGLNDNIKAMADRYAGEGYTVLAVDMFGGNVATTSDAAARQYQAAMQNVAAGESNLVAAADYLRSHGATSVGSIGYCFGGHWSLRAGLAGGSKVNAVVIFYGAPITDVKDLARLKAPVLGLFSGKDNGIPEKAVRAMEAALKEGGHQATIHFYPDANHAFANPSGQSYNKTAADDSWNRTLAFFKANLR